LHNWVKLDREQGGGRGERGLSESEREELARLRRQKAEMAKEHAREKAAWEKQRAELEMERDVLKRSVVLWVKDSMNR
jgi:transposase